MPWMFAIHARDYAKVVDNKMRRKQNDPYYVDWSIRGIPKRIKKAPYLQQNYHIVDFDNGPDNWAAFDETMKGLKSDLARYVLLQDDKTNLNVDWSSNGMPKVFQT